MFFVESRPDWVNNNELTQPHQKHSIPIGVFYHWAQFMNSIRFGSGKEEAYGLDVYTFNRSCLPDDIGALSHFMVTYLSQIFHWPLLFSHNILVVPYLARDVCDLFGNNLSRCTYHISGSWQWNPQINLKNCPSLCSPRKPFSGLFHWYELFT